MPSIHTSWKRFHAPDAVPGQRVRLPPDEAHHLVRVLRIVRGEYVAIFNGRGREFLARVETHGREAEVTIVAEIQPAAESTVRLTLAQAVLKGGKMDDIVRDATMLGAFAIHPVVTTRVNVPRRAMRSAGERWTSIAVASAKQCGRAVVPEIHAVVDLESFLRSDGSAKRLLLVEPSAALRVQTVGSLRNEPQPESCSLLIGPEGGWSAEEVAMAIELGAVPVSLGPMTLRAEVAPIAALAVVRSNWG